ncbi:MAG: 1-(5-phosphoribosyl)-5-[(5-phosphoribosylamino)methylideneamino]imidazole-4-carboxamide isomerase [Alphaproteobacteria bacterium]
MIIFPAIDLKDGQAVRLEEGDMGRVTVFNDDPAAQAKLFVDQGASWLHLVDLNGAFAGKPVNAEVVRQIRKATPASIQLGGGIRDLATIENWFDCGITRVILGTVALKNPALVREACKKHPGKIVVGIDARDGFVAAEGWAESSNVPVFELADRFADCGVAAIVFTDIGRDGLLKGVNLEATVALANHTSIPVIASGGVADMKDVEGLLAATHGITAGKGGLEGVISGRAIYDGRLDLAEAMAYVNKATSTC